jgi:CRP/FNR family cyclic AMP-dependent transcriptional regulator
MPSIEIFKNEPDVRAFAAGSAIFKEGETGDLMFAVLEGEVELRKGPRVLRSVATGEIFGEMAIIDNQPRTADAIALTDCSVAAVNQKRFLTLVSNTPFFAIQMLQLLSERLREETGA